MSKDETPILEAASAEFEAQQKFRRKRLLLALAGTVTLAALGTGTWWMLYGSRYVSTDNAYTAVETAQVTPAVSGIVRDVRVADTQPVKSGDVLVVLDDVDARLALDQAEAELGRSMRRVKGYYANDLSLSAQIDSRVFEKKRAEAQLAAAFSDLQRAEVDLTRREALARSGSVSGEELTKARNAYEDARANLSSAQAAIDAAQANHSAAIGSRAANAVLIADATQETNPEVELARAKRDQARVNLERTVIRAPIDGIVAKRAVQVGQQVREGTALLSVVPVAQVHVDANFKEVQLDKVRIGQPVVVTSDLYGGATKYHGVVSGLSGGTGSTFATIPAQNATGNWIKVVQRVPVRIELDRAELASHPLQVGLSMVATIDTRSPKVN